MFMSQKHGYADPYSKDVIAEEVDFSILKSSKTCTPGGCIFANFSELLFWTHEIGLFLTQNLNPASEMAEA